MTEQQTQQQQQQQVPPVLVKAGLVFSESIPLTELLCKPKLLPIRGTALERLEELDKQIAEKRKEADVNSGAISATESLSIAVNPSSSAAAAAAAGPAFIGEEGNYEEENNNNNNPDSPNKQKDLQRRKSNPDQKNFQF